MSSIRSTIQAVFPEAIFLDGPEFDAAIIGIVEGAGMEQRVLYDYDKALAVLVAQGMSEDEALEWASYNWGAGGAFVGENTPAFLNRPDE